MTHIVCIANILHILWQILCLKQIYCRFCDKYCVWSKYIADFVTNIVCEANLLQILWQILCVKQICCRFCDNYCVWSKYIAHIVTNIVFEAIILQTLVQISCVKQGRVRQAAGQSLRSARAIFRKLPCSVHFTFRSAYFTFQITIS